MFTKKVFNVFRPDITTCILFLISCILYSPETGKAQSLYTNFSVSSFYTVREKDPTTFLDPQNRVIPVKNYFYHFVNSKGRIESLLNMGYNFKIEYQDLGEHSVGFTFRELYMSMDISENGFLLIGRKITDWGKGFYKRPAAILDPERTAQDINDNFNRYKGMDQILFKYFFENVSLSAVAATDLDRASWKQSAFWAVKESGVVGSFELSFIQGGYQEGKFFGGVTVTYVPVDILELYGEGIYFNKTTVRKVYENSVQTFQKDRTEFTIGAMFTIPWKEKQDIRWILEFYFNSNGWNASDRDRYRFFIGENYRNMFSPDSVIRSVAAANYLAGTSLFNIDRINRMNLFSVIDNIPALPGRIYFRPVLIYSLVDNSYIAQIIFTKSVGRYIDVISYGNYFGGSKGSLYRSIPYQYEVVLGINLHF